MYSRVFLLFWFIATCSAAIADEPNDFVQILESGRYELGSTLRILEDKTGDMTVEQVSGIDNDKFVRSMVEIPNLGITPYTFWLEINIAGVEGSEGGSGEEWYLEIGRALLEVAELYEPDAKGGYVVRSADTRRPFDEREIYHVNSVFPMTIDSSENLTLYLKIKSPRASLYLPVTLWKPEAFAQKVAVEEFFYGMYYGSMLVLILYNLFIYFTVRDVSYIYYVTYLVIVPTFLLIHSGHGVLHVPYVYELLTVNSLAAILWCLYAAVMLFMRSFLEIKQRHPVINRVTDIFLILFLINVILSQYLDGSFVVKFTAITPTFLAPFVIWVGCYSWAKGNKNGKFYVFSWLPLIVGTLFNSIVLSGFVALNAMSEILLPLGVILEATILSLALANRVKLSQELVLCSNREKSNNLKKYQSIFNNSLQGLYRMSMDGRVASANMAFIKAFGFSKIGQIKNENVKVSRSIFVGGVSDYDVMRRGEVIENSIIIPSVGNDTHMFHSAKMVFDDVGCPSHVEGSLTDNTEMYKKLKAISESENERIKNDIAQQVMDTANQFLSMMSHHIRTPLTAIIGYGELLKDGKGSAKERREWVDVVVNNSNSLLKLINDILDYSKIDADKFSIESIEVNIDDIVADIHREFSKMATSLGLYFKVDYQSAIPSKIVGDPTRVVQILNNLCDNAIKYCHEGGVILRLDWDSINEQIRFSVVDTGVGISRSKQRSLFDMFSRGDGEYSDAGLGLVLSRKLALLMGGDVTVESNVGKGSVFTLVTGSGLPSDVGWVSKVREVDVTSVASLSGTVLLAEDNVVNQKLIERILMKAGLAVVIVNDGVEACDYCDDTLPDFILMDINMPNRDGVEATAYLRGKGYSMPIYALTAETDQEEINRILTAGCQGFLTKPLNKKELNRILSQYLEVSL